jgi:hypothetical protein
VAKIRTSQYTFTRGQLGADLDFRSDNELYQAGAKTITNAFVLPQGGVVKRKGFEYINTVTGAIRIRKFAFSDTQEYVLVFGDAELLIYKDDVLVFDSSTGGMTVPYAAADIPTLDFSQKYDAMFIVHKDYKPYQLTRGATNADWTLAEIAFKSIPFEKFNTTQTLTPSGTTGSINLTLSAGSDYWTANHVGVKVFVNGGYVQITSITSGLIAVGTVTTWHTITSLTGTGADDAWSEEAWSAAHGYPRTVTQHQSRLLFGGTRDLPQSIFASVSFDNLDFDDSSTDADFSWTKEIGTQEVNYIRAIIGKQDIYIFTNAEEFVIDGTDAVTATAGRIYLQNSIGCAELEPLKVNSDLVYVSADSKGVYLMRYDADQGKYIPTSMTTLSQSIINSPVDVAYISNYDDTQANFMIIVNGDGTMSSLTLDTDKKVYGWSTHTTNGLIKGAEVISNNLYVLVERGGTMYLEKLTEQEIYLDHWYNGSAGTAKSLWNGALSLAGYTVGCVASENDTDIETYYIHDDILIGSSGDFQTNSDVRAVAIGHRYTCTLETLALAFGHYGQLIRGERIRKTRAEIRVRKTKQFTVDGYTVDERKIGEALLDANLPDIDKIIDVGLSGIGTNITVKVESAEPNPLRVLGLTVEVQYRRPS